MGLKQHLANDIRTTICIKCAKEIPFYVNRNSKYCPRCKAKKNPLPKI